MRSSQNLGISVAQNDIEVEFFHNASKVKDFEGNIHLDSRNNR